MSNAVTAARTLQIMLKSGTTVDFEAVLTNCYSRLIAAGDTVLDIGAHGGRHLRHFLALVGATGRVIGIEPLPFMFSHLQAEFGANSRVELLNIALSSFDGTSIFTVVKNAPEESGLREKIYNLAEVELEKTTVQVRRLDTLDLMMERLEFVKIDVEGAELDLLAGSVATLNRFRPFVSIEYGFPAYSAYGKTKLDLFQMSQQVGYLCCDLFGNQIETAADWNLVCDFAYWDYILVPVERKNDYLSRYV